MFFLKNIISNSKLEAGDWNMRYSICLETYLIFKNSIKESLSMEFGRFSCDFRVFRCLVRFLSISLEIDGFAVHTQSQAKLHAQNLFSVVFFFTECL